MTSTQKLAAVALGALLLTSVAGCRQIGVGAPSSTETAPATVPMETPTPPAPPTKKPSSAAPTSAKPSSAAPTTAAPTGKLVTMKWVEVHVPAGWTSVIRPESGKSAGHIRLAHTASDVKSYFLTIDNVIVNPKNGLGPSVAGQCGAYVQLQAKAWFKAGWKEGPHETILIPGKDGSAYMCGVRGYLTDDAQWGKLSGKMVELIISVAGNPKGQAFAQFTLLPAGDNPQAGKAGGEAGQMFTEVLTNFLKKKS